MTRDKQSRSFLGGLAAGLAMVSLVLVPTESRAQIDPLSPTTNWIAVMFRGLAEPANDQQTGSSESDLVGTVNQASFYTSFYNAGTPSTTDGQVGFRLRFAAEKSPAGYSALSFVGVDGNQDGRLDLYLGVDNQGSGSKIAIWKPMPGTNLNTTPNNTSINSTPVFSYTEIGANYAWTVVNSTNDPTGSNYNIDGASGNGEEDRFLTFVVPFADVVSAMLTVGLSNFNENTPVNYVAGASTQPNNFNQDLNGVLGGVNSMTNWFDLGVLSQPYSMNGILIPEPGTSGLILLGFAGLLCRFTRPRKWLRL